MAKKWKSPDATVFGPPREFEGTDKDRYELERWSIRDQKTVRDYNRDDIEED